MLRFDLYIGFDRVLENHKVEPIREGDVLEDSAYTLQRTLQREAGDVVWKLTENQIHEDGANVFLFSTDAGGNDAIFYVFPDDYKHLTPSALTIGKCLLELTAGIPDEVRTRHTMQVGIEELIARGGSLPRISFCKAWIGARKRQQR